MRVENFPPEEDPPLAEDINAYNLYNVGMKTLLLIDANSLIHRAFHALPPLTAPDGRPTNALYGVSTILLKIWKDEKPDYAAALFDRPEPTFRKEQYKEYKAQRVKAPDELISQIIETRNLFSSFGLKVFEKSGFEADDLIATLAQKFKDLPDLKVIILTGDLDTLQMVEGEKLVVRTFRKGVTDTYTYDERAVRLRYGLDPRQLLDYKTLVGDVSDNIKGVPGVGPKTATDILQKYGTLDNFLENVGEEPKLAKKIIGQEKLLEQSKMLVTLKKDVQLSVDEIGDLKILEQPSVVAEYFSKLGFESLKKRIGGGIPDREVSEGVKEGYSVKSVSHRAVDAGGVSQGSMFQNVPSVISYDVILVGDVLGQKDLGSEKLKVGFDLKAKIKKFWNEELDLKGPYFDLGIAFWLLDPDFKKYDAQSVFRKFLKKEFDGDQEKLKEVLNYVKKQIKDYEMDKVAEQIEMPIIRALAKMEREGIFVNNQKLKKLDEEVSGEIRSVTSKIYKIAGQEFNINSPQQMGKILFDVLKISDQGVKKTPGGARSTNFEVLDSIQDRHEIISLIMQYREHFKIQSTYVRPLLELRDKDGLIHTEFVQTGTATGRISSQNPNLQNIPQESMWSKKLRSTFEAKEGHSFLSFDYSQIELRVLAALAEDRNMLEAFKAGEDIHTLTASKVLGIPIEAVQAKDRRLAKTLNFGLIYGMGVSAFQKTSGLSRAEAQNFVGAYFREFSAIKEWQEKIKKETRSLGYVKTMSGRRRYLSDISSGQPRYVAEAERAAINQPVQGMAADIIKMAMVRIAKKIEEEKDLVRGVKMLLSIHDELLFEVRDDMIFTVLPVFKEMMEGVFDLGVPLRVEAAQGKDWGHMEKIKIA